MRALVLSLAVALGACVAAEPPTQGDCGAARMQALIGEGYERLELMDLPVGTRVIEPGAAVTEDFSPTRLNFDLDARGRIVRAWCG